MGNDLTYEEINRVKRDIKVFRDYLKQSVEDREKKIHENDLSFFSFIAKRIIFFKYFTSGFSTPETQHFCKVLISDLYNLILSLLDEEYRYAYLNERSIIENYCRLILQRTMEESHITSLLIESLKQEEFKFYFNQDDYSLLKNEYKKACEFIHGGESLSSSLKFVMEEYAVYTWSQKEKNEYYERLKKLLKFLEKMLISKYTDYVDVCFFRRKSLLAYLLNDEVLDIIFSD